MDTQGEITYATVKQIIGKTGKRLKELMVAGSMFSIYLLDLAISFLSEQ
jgi:hypothetical protein